MAASKGPQNGLIIVKYTGLLAMSKTLLDSENELRSPNMSGVVRGAAKVWDENYKGEGVHVGGWRLLSEYTKAMRIWRGYTEEHPLMVQSGGLYRAAVNFPLNFKSSAGSITTAAGRLNDATPTTTTIYTTRNRVILTISGSKVANQTGGSDMGEGWQKRSAHRLPARRFWFANAAVREEMQKGFMDNLIHWKKLGL